MTTTERDLQHEPLNLAVIIGSTRPGRRASRVSRWLMAQLAERDDLAVDLIDLELLDLPAALPPDDHPAAAELVQRVDRADAFIVVTPEYNHGYPRDATEIRSLLDAMADGFNARDVPRADQHFSADAVFVAPDGRRVEGRDALVRYHEARLAGPASTWTTDYHVLKTTFVDPRVAIVHTAQDVNTGGGTFRNHGTFVFVKRDGKWWITSAHNTNVVTTEDQTESAHAHQT